MKSLVLLGLVAVFGIAYARPDEKYTVKYDNVNLDDILSNTRLLQGYYRCLLGEVTCSPDGQELKEVLPEALTTECAKCSEKQKEGSKKVIRYLIDNHRDWWDKLEAKYDQDGSYRKKYEAEIKKEGLNL